MRVLVVRRSRHDRSVIVLAQDVRRGDLLIGPVGSRPFLAPCLALEDALYRGFRVTFRYLMLREVEWDVAAYDPATELEIWRRS